MFKWIRRFLSEPPSPCRVKIMSKDYEHHSQRRRTMQAVCQYDGGRLKFDTTGLSGVCAECRRRWHLCYDAAGFVLDISQDETLIRDERTLYKAFSTKSNRSVL